MTQAFAKELQALLKKHNLCLCAGDIMIAPLEKGEKQTITATKRYRYSAPYDFITINTTKPMQPKIDMSDKLRSKFDKGISGFTFKEFRNPIDGKEIAGSQQLRDFERRYGVKQCGNDLLKTNQQRKEHDDRKRSQHSDASYYEH